MEESKYDGKMYDVLVVGAGMIGSATAHHVAQMEPSLSVCLIGPSEPKSKDAYAGEQMLGAFFDEGRLTRQMYTHPAWAIIAKRAAKNYRQIEKESGIPFYSEVGCLTIMESGSDYLKRHEEVAKQLNINVQRLSKEDAQKKFPYLDYEHGDEAWFEPREAGYINPRRLVDAEQILAKRYGCMVVHDVVLQVEQIMLTDGSSCMEISTRESGKFLAKKVMLATGAFTEYQRLLPHRVIPDVSIVTQTVILAELSEADQQIMRNMPSMMYNGAGHQVDGSNYLYTYILPPIKYPDGKVYLKIGHMDNPGVYRTLENLTDIHEHYRSPGIQEAIILLKKILQKLFPDFHPLAVVTDACVTCHTASGLAYLDLVHPQLGVAIGGNGTAGKSCDEIGRMAAELVISGRWRSDLPADWFKFTRKTSSNVRQINYAKL